VEQTSVVRKTRDLERTRAALLRAAAEAMAERGTKVSLAHVAERAGVSKSGLLHHFPSRDALIVALVEDANRRLHETVLTHLEPSETEPGKLLRAYVRALCSPSEALSQYFTSAPTWAGVGQIPAAAEALQSDAAWWAEQLSADGLHPERVLVVRRAAEGTAAALAAGEESAESLARVRELLLNLTRGAALPS
jgi:AcrR family transcriptional regulator